MAQRASNREWKDGLKSPLWRALNRRRAVDYGVVLSVTALVLAVTHALVPDASFRVDNITIALLVVAALPLLGRFVSRIKAGDLEVDFRELTVHQQVMMLIDGVARQQQWTFYPPREGETELGRAFGQLVGVLLRSVHGEFIERLRKWLEEGNDNLRWFASEVIGFFRVEELRRELRPLLRDAAPDQVWEAWRLNCLWAYSRFDGYRSLDEFLSRTRSGDNQRWLLHAYSQMVTEEGEPLEVFLESLERVVGQGSLTSDNTRRAVGLVSEIKQRL